MSKDNRSLESFLNISYPESCGIGRIGTMFYQLGNKRKAQEIFEGLVEANPESADARTALGAVLVSMNRHQNALPHLLKAVELQPDKIASYVNLAEVYIRQGDLLKAVENLSEAVRRDQTNTSSAASRARVLILEINKIIKLAS